MKGQPRDHIAHQRMSTEIGDQVSNNLQKEPRRGAPNAAVQRLLAAWRGEIEANYVYDSVAARERDPRRSDILRRIAAGEQSHRARLEARLQELGVPIPDPASVHISFWLRLQVRLAPIDRLLSAREAAEDDEILTRYGKPTGDAATDALLRDIRRDEQSHAMAVNEMLGMPTDVDADAAASVTQNRLDRILNRETHRTGSGWVSDAIYGANDGLAAVFGIVAGVSGATGATERSVLTAGWQAQWLRRSPWAWEHGLPRVRQQRLPRRISRRSARNWSTTLPKRRKNSPSSTN